MIRSILTCSFLFILIVRLMGQNVELRHTSAGLLPTELSYLNLINRVLAERDPSHSKKWSVSLSCFDEFAKEVARLPEFYYKQGLYVHDWPNAEQKVLSVLEKLDPQIYDGYYQVIIINDAEAKSSILPGWNCIDICWAACLCSK